MKEGSLFRFPQKRTQNFTKNVNHKNYFELKGAKIVIYLSENVEIAFCYFIQLLRFH